MKNSWQLIINPSSSVCRKIKRLVKRVIGFIIKESLLDIIQHIKNKKVDGISIECRFVNILADSPHLLPEHIRYMPPKEENKFYNCIGTFKRISFSFKPH